jgi:hypothetical protein
MSYTCKNYEDLGGNRMVIGGELHLEDAAIISVGKNAVAAKMMRYQVAAAKATAAVANGIHAAVTDTGVSQVITTGITNPSVPRNVTATAGGTGANITAVRVIVAGTDFDDAVITETLPVFTAATPGLVQGLKAFKTITSITIPANGTGVTTAVGFGEVLGLPSLLSQNTVVRTFLNNVKETTDPTIAVDAVNLSGNTMKLNSTLNGTAVDTYYIK